jgi:hypothetical protein
MNQVVHATCETGRAWRKPAPTAMAARSPAAGRTDLGGRP